MLDQQFIEPSMVECALSYARQGIKIFPLRPREKTPLTKHGYKDATSDESQIQTWWVQWPDANIGLATGRVSGLVVIDVDGPQGEESLKSLPPMPATWEVSTGRGRHLYYRSPEGASVGSSAGRLGEKLDVRGEGGYVVAPPSIHPNGHRYQ